MTNPADEEKGRELWPRIWDQVKVEPKTRSETHVQIQHRLPPGVKSGSPGLLVKTHGVRLSAGAFESDPREKINQRVRTGKGRAVVGIDVESGLPIAGIAFHLEPGKPVLIKAFAVELVDGQPTERGVATRRLLKAYVHVVGLKFSGITDVYYGDAMRVSEPIQRDLAALGFRLGDQGLFSEPAEYYRQGAGSTVTL